MGLCDRVSPHYPQVHRDLVMTGAILHDIGKLEELRWSLNFDYTLECFFFQAEDRIRDLTVTGVQTCALPISATTCSAIRNVATSCWRRSKPANRAPPVRSRSEERRVGKECRCRRSRSH